MSEKTWNHTSSDSPRHRADANNSLSGNHRSPDSPRAREDSNNSWLGLGIGVAAIGAAAFGYWLSGSSSSNETDSARTQSELENKSNMNSKLHDMKINDDGPSTNRKERQQRRGVPRSSVPSNPVINSLNALLYDIYLRYIALNDEDFEVYYNIFMNIFLQIHTKMKEVDQYYAQYSSEVQLAGSHSDKLRIQKPDEFDVDVVIGLPVNIKSNPSNPKDSDIVFEMKSPGFIQLKMGVQFQKLPMRDKEMWLINKTAFNWMDEKKYLQRSEFMNWYKSILTLALNQFPKGSNGLPTLIVDGVHYTVSRSFSGPAETIFIENKSKGIKLDVDFVPALKFPEARWPVDGDIGSYQPIPKGCNAPQRVWLVVPKPNKDGQTEQDKNRSWRIAMHEQERAMMHNLKHLKQTIRLLKKLRDSQGMTKIASYHLKTLFFWEIKQQNDSEFWRNDPAYLFTFMVKKFHSALVAKRIPYFWNAKNNLIGSVKPDILSGYATKLSKLIVVLDNPTQYKEVARYLLTSSEFTEYAKFL